jgi:hypothetical protein
VGKYSQIDIGLIKLAKVETADFQEQSSRDNFIRQYFVFMSSRSESTVKECYAS